jgi:tetratricopeptide (TPR) repeat protein
MLILLVGFVETSSHAFPSTYESSIEQAKIECAAGNTTLGIRLLAEVYAKTNNAVLVYNQGRCYEQNNMREQAIARFEEYLRIDTSLSQEEIVELQARIEKLQAAIDVATAAPPSHLASPIPILSSPPTPPSPTPSPVVLHSPTSAPRIASHGSGLRKAAFITGGLALMSFGAAIVCNLKANQVRRELNDLSKIQRYDREKENKESTYKTATWVGYGLGVAALISSSTLFLLDFSSTPKISERVSILPTISPNMIALSLHRTY